MLENTTLGFLSVVTIVTVGCVWVATGAHSSWVVHVVWAAPVAHTEMVRRCGVSGGWQLNGVVIGGYGGV